MGIFYLKVYWFSENLYCNMANVKLSFLDENGDNELQVFCNTLDKIYIAINENDIGYEKNAAFIVFDVDTAVKLSKELRRQIAVLKERLTLNSEQNG